MRPTVTLLAAALAACAGARPAPTPSAAPALEGRPLAARALDADAAAYWDLSLAQRADVAPRVSEDAPPDEVRRSFAPWLRRRAQGLAELARRVPALDRRSADDALFASVVYAVVAEELRDAVRALPAPRALPPEAAAEWRSLRDAQSMPLARHARDAWTRCDAVVARASTALRAWEPVCGHRARALEAQLASAPQPAPRPTPPPRREVSIPPECNGPELQRAPADPLAPPPDERRPREVVLRYEGARFEGPARARFMAAVRAALARSPGVRLVPQAEVAAAEALRAQRRWRAGGLVCGQPPPLPALLAARHPNLVVGDVDAWCGTVLGDEGEGASRSLCTLGVSFRRAGADDREGLPAYRAVDVTGDPADVGRWVAAAAQLADPGARPSVGGLFGAMMGGPGEVYRALDGGDNDPWLRVMATLRAWDDDAPRAALLACATREGGVGSYRATWTIAPDGAARDVAVTTETAPTDGSGERVAECLRGALARVPFPCPRGGAAVQARARLCVGWDATSQPASGR